MRWMLPAQLLRGILIAGALYPFLGALQSWSFTRRFLSLAALYIVLGQWTSPVAGASTIERWVILRPEFTTPDIILRVVPEGLIQGLAFGAWLSRWLSPSKQALHVTAATPGS
jgi:nitroreductase